MEERRKKSERGGDKERLLLPILSRFYRSHHSDCLDFLGLVQRMMNASEIEFCRKVGGKMVAVTTEESSKVPNDGQQEKMPKPLTIFYKGEISPK